MCSDPADGLKPLLFFGLRVVTLRAVKGEQGWPGRSDRGNRARQLHGVAAVGADRGRGRIHAFDIAMTQ